MGDNGVPDFLAPGLNIVFVGFNPGIRSGETGHHFANPTNRFWKLLHEAGITPRKYKPEDGRLLLELGLGLTNIVPRTTRAASDIKPEEFTEGRQQLLDKLRHYRPRVVCLVGKGVYQAYSGKNQATWGYQPDSIVPGIRDFVAPNSSGLVRMKLDQLVSIYRLIT
ncbi:MAG: G/U mismatch-specific DNA glycosylase [Firmicutes bacterium HGW-Firmicutes-15]|nr:MAG: G/U mismatch-specific DNA glycosylase [Firmicutes bacterium HGW-Firmicutes-15]